MECSGLALTQSATCINNAATGLVSYGLPTPYHLQPSFPVIIKWTWPPAPSWTPSALSTSCPAPSHGLPELLGSQEDNGKGTLFKTSHMASLSRNELATQKSKTSSQLP